MQCSLPTPQMFCPGRSCSSSRQPITNARHHVGQPPARHCTQRQGQPMEQRRQRLQPVRAEAAEQETAAPVDSAESGPQRCKLCGVALASAPRGCDNEGHVIKGLGSWPGFGWFEALRVYGHCPEAQKKGIAYTRKGDTLDEIMFGKK